jgi:tetratricopeptide (TPR) repeat protein
VTTPTETRIDRASLLVDLGRWTEARRELTAALASDPDSYRAHCLLGACLLALDDATRGLDHAEIAVRLRPDDEWGHRVRSSALNQLGRHEEAEAAAREAVRVAPDDPLVHVRLAKALLALPGRVEEAHQAVERSLALEPDRAATHLAAAAVADAGGDEERERAAYRRVLALDPENADAINGLAALDNERGRFGSALRHQAGAVTFDPTDPLYRENVDTIGRNLVALGVLVTTVAALPLLGLAAAETTGAFASGWPRMVVGLAAVAAYGVVLWRMLRDQPAVIRRYLRRSLVRLPATQIRFTFLLIVPAWLLLAAAALLSTLAATVASVLLVVLFVAARAGYPDRTDSQDRP